jgi:acyl-coenzyme A synthetase/AMP-(fatty) acid ligase
MMRMVLEADIEPARISSLISVWSGTAPVRAEERDAFSEKYGIPVLGNYGATEFCGPIASWSLDDHQRYFSTRSHAVGRIDPSIAEIRVRNPEGKLLGKKGAIGALEFKVHRLGNHWMGTNDLGSVDTDGFLTLHGRKDDVIMRGGFKLSPTAISDVLRKHPSIRNAAVVGIADERLGQVPVAAVELVENASIEYAEVQDFVRTHLPAYFVPTNILAVEELPRNPAMKLDRRAIAKLFDA